MPQYSNAQLPPEIEVLFKAAREQSITPKDFCRSLQKQGVSGARAMLYIRDAFGLPLEEAKALAIENEYGSVETWERLVEEALEEP